jgi:hypothetical protein
VIESHGFPVQLPIVDDIFEDPDQLVCLRESIGFFPKSFRLVAHDEDARMIVFGVNVLAQLVKRPVNVFLLTGQK